MTTSGNALVNRRCKLTIANPSSNPKDFKGTKTVDIIEIDGGKTDDANRPGMRISFDITKTSKKEPNTCQIVVTNLSPSRRSSLQQKGVKVLLEAGYQSTGVFRVFAGDVRFIDHVRNGADWDTTMHLGDGERSWKYARISESFATGTNASDVLKAHANAMGLDLGNVVAQADGLSQKLDQGFAAGGFAARSLDLFVKSLRKTWSIQDGQLQILDPYAALDLPIPEISDTSGLVGSPEMGSPRKKGKPALVKFQSLLIQTKPGAKVKLVSERYNGYLRVDSCKFEGDTHGGNWFTNIDGEVLK